MRNVIHKQVNLENRSRRTNLLFFGLSDADKETWDEAEAKVISLCAEQLNVPVSLSSIERAHRIGKGAEGKLRPIVVIFAQFKYKQRVLSAASKQKGTDFSLSEDFSRTVPISSSKLVAFARERHEKRNLKYDKLNMDAKTYFWDVSGSTVQECDSSSRTAVGTQRELSNKTTVVVQEGKR